MLVGKQSTFASRLRKRLSYRVSHEVEDTFPLTSDAKPPAQQLSAVLVALSRVPTLLKLARVLALSTLVVLSTLAPRSISLLLLWPLLLLLPEVAARAENSTTSRQASPHPLHNIGIDERERERERELSLIHS